MGLAGGGLDGKGRAASGVTVQLCQHHTVNPESLIEGTGGVDRVLTGHSVHHQQNLVGMDRGLHPLQLVHEGFIHMEPAGGIQKYQIIAVVSGVANGVCRDGNRDRPALPRKPGGPTDRPQPLTAQ